MSPRLYVYKLTTDNGGAPCIKGGLLSLAICKPRIRRTAQPDDWIFGLGGKRLQGRLIYIARVTKRVENGLYYEDGAYEGRDDRIYRWENGQFKLRDGAKYHKDTDHRNRDLGKDRSNATALLSDDFRYYGKKGKKPNPNRFPQVTELLARLTQGERVNLREKVEEELQDLQKSEWQAHPNDKVLGPPSDSDCCRPCNRSEGNVVCGRVIS